MNRNAVNIVFIGMMGTFKTSVSRIVAQERKLPLIDTDEWFVREYGDISIFFETYGEGEFRKKETEIVARAAANVPSVISTGGGVVLRPENMRVLKEHGVIVLLCARPAVISARVRGGDGRPLLKGDTMSNITRILREREGLYEQYADYTIDNSDMSPADCAEAVLAALNG